MYYLLPLLYNYDCLFEPDFKRGIDSSSVMSASLVGWVRIMASECVDNFPFRELILASKLSTITCTRPVSDEEMPCTCGSFMAATAADRLNRLSVVLSQ